MVAYEETGKSSYTDCIALTSKVQRNAVGRNPRSSVVISFPYSSAFVRYSVGRRRIRIRIVKRRRRRNVENVMDIFHALARSRVKGRVSLSSV